MRNRNEFLLDPTQEDPWFTSVPALVSFVLLSLVILIIPIALLLVHTSWVLLWYAGYPLLIALSLFLRYKKFYYFSSILAIVGVYGILVWLMWLMGFEKATPLMCWVVALLPWVLFDDERTVTAIFLSAFPVAFSFVVHDLPKGERILFPAEQELVKQILNISIALGAFSCIYALRRQYWRLKKRRSIESEFYSTILDSIPLPIIIKDGVTLEYVYFNEAAELTYDLARGSIQSNKTTFAEASATAVSTLDREALRSVSFHLEGEESLVHQTGLVWKFRTYRIPLQIQSSGRRLLVTISEDLRAMQLLMEQAEENRAFTQKMTHLLLPLVLRFDPLTQHLAVLRSLHPRFENNFLRQSVINYIEERFVEQGIPSAATQHLFQIDGARYIVFYGKLPQSEDCHAVVLALNATEFLIGG